MAHSLTHSRQRVLHPLRRADLKSRIKEKFPEVKHGAILLCAGFEQDRMVFRQESSFYYLTGITEPAISMLIDLEGKTTLFVPAHEGNRSAWMKTDLDDVIASPKAWGIDEVVKLGKPIAGYQVPPLAPAAMYDDLIAHLSALSAKGYTLFTLSPTNAHENVEQRMFLARLLSWVPGFAERVQDISPLVAEMRRSKDMAEIEALYKAIEITTLAHEAAATAIVPEVNEAEIQATIEYMMTGSQARIAFPSIVGGGINSTILHYHANNQPLKAGDLVVVDIGAEADYYCADLTRTYPVSGTFTPRQKEVYMAVLETQEYIAEIAKPGMWLSNKEKPEQSLHHLAVAFLEKRGFGRYFIHGIGHFLGLDVHDVGDRNVPLDEGDVFTIEPGVYIPEEKIGIRIEDDYWMTKGGVVCLSEELAKKPEDIERLMQERNAASHTSFIPDMSSESEIAES